MQVCGEGTSDIFFKITHKAVDVSLVRVHVNPQISNLTAWSYPAVEVTGNCNDVACEVNFASELLRLSTASCGEIEARYGAEVWLGKPELYLRATEGESWCSVLRACEPRY